MSEEFANFELEPHYVENEKGYILTLFRVRVDNLRKDKSNEKRPAVLLVHGFLCSGTEWLCLPAGKALPLILVQEGYDVWIACLRGSHWTGDKAHVTLTKEDAEFWDFCVDDLGYHDIPAFIDFVLQSTGNERIFYVGHSLGASLLFITLSTRPEYNSKIEVMAALAPGIGGRECSIFLVGKISAPFFTLLGKSKFIYRRGIFQACAATWAKTLFPYVPSKRCLGMAGWALKMMASRYLLQVVNHNHMELERCAKVSEQFPGGTSLKAVSNVMQFYYYKKFQKYDYGRGGNLKRYGQPHPPQYQLERVTAPVAIFTSEHDYLLPAQEVLEESKRLKNVIFAKSIQEEFFHGDFMIGSNAHELVYKDVVNVFGGFKPKK